MTLYIIFLAFSLKIDKFFNIIGKKGTFSLGTIFSLGSALALILINEDNRQLIYLIVVFIGIS